MGGMALGDIDACFVWQVWQVWHLVTCMLTLGGLFFLGFFSRFFLGIFSRFLVEGRCEEGRKEGMGEGSKKNRDQKNK